MSIPIWARRSILAAGLMAAGGAWADTNYDLMVNHDAYQVIANGASGDIGTGSAVVDGAVGGKFVYRAKPKINGAAGLVSNAVLTQQLPVGAIFQSVAAPVGVNCSPALATGTVITVSDVISCTITTLTEVEQNIDFKVILPTSGTNHKAFATITAPDNIDPNADNDNEIERNITTYERADLAVEFSSPTPDSTHQQGDVVSYDIQVNNTNSEYAHPLKAGEKAVVRFSLPEGTGFSGSPTSEDNAWSCEQKIDGTATPPVDFQECVYTAPAGGVDKNTDLPWLKIPVVVEASGGGTTALVSVAGQTVGGAVFVDAYPDNNSSEVVIKFEPNTQLDMKLVKSVSPAVVDFKEASVPVTYTLKVTRNSGGMMPELPITIIDTLPEHVSFANGETGAGWSCSAIGQAVTCEFTDATQINSNGHLPELTFDANVAAGSVTLVDGQSMIENKAILNVANEPIANQTNNNTSRANLTVSNKANLAIEKTASVSVIAQGQEFSYTIAVQNNGPLDVLSDQTITVVDVLDAQFEYVADPIEAPWSCDVSPVVWAAGTSQTVTCTLSEGIESGTSKDLKIKVKAHLSGGAQWATIGNEASVSCPDGRECPGWADGKQLTNKPTVNISDLVADLSITKEAAITDDSSTYGPNASGAEVVYTLKVKNAVPAGGDAAGFQTAKTVTVTDTITNLLNNNVSGAAHPVTGTPRYTNNRFVEASYLSPDPDTYPLGMTVSDCTYANTGNHTTTVTCELQNVPVGDDEYTILINARQYVNPNGGDQNNKITNTANVGSTDTAEHNIDNNKDSAEVTLEALTNMSAQKQASVSEAAAGQRIDYTLSATNHGPSRATDVKVVDTLPVGMIWVAAPTFSGGGTPSCSVTGTGGGSIAPGLLITAANQDMTCVWGTAFNGGTGTTVRSVNYALRSPNVNYPDSATNDAYVDTATKETIPLSADDTDNKTSKIVTFDKPKLNVLINMGHNKDGLPIDQGASSETEYTITVTNSGESTSYAANVEMFNRFPAAGSTASFDSVAINSVSLVSGDNRFSIDNCAFVATPESGLLCEFDWLAPNESVDIKFTMSAKAINNGDIPVGTIIHEASVSADGEYLGDDVNVEDDNSVTDRTSAYDSAKVDNIDDLRFVDLSITKKSSVFSPEDESKDAAEVGDTIRYTLVVTNEELAGSQPPRHLVNGNAVVTDILPEGLEFVGPVPAGCVWEEPKLQCVITDLNAGASINFEFDVKVNKLSYGQKAIRNTATVKSPGDDNPGNDEDPEETPSVPPLNPAPVPVDSPLALLAMILGIGWITRRFHMRKHA